MLVLGAFHSDEFEARQTHQLSRRCLAVVKYFSTALASLHLSADWNFFKSETKASNDREICLRLASAMSRHISGEPDAMRVVSRKPVAHSPTCVWGCAGLKTRFTSVAATMCGRWLDRLTSKSCCAASSRSVRAPSDFQNCSSLRTALALDFFVGVTMQTALAYKSARAASTPIFSPPAIGWLPTKCAPDLAIMDSSSRTTSAFTLPTSVTIAPRFNAGRICCASARIWASGVQKITRSAPETAASRSVVA